MLKTLKVKSFAIIKDITVEFNNGMTVLTGETGAGKSLVIDTISLLLGARADSDMIRYGEECATVEGVFSRTLKLDELFDKLGIQILDDIIIHREIYTSSKNVIKVNNQMVSLTNLKQIAIYLADIHVQNDTYKLFNPENYLSILDPINDTKFDKALNDYRLALYSYNNIYKEYEHIKNSKEKALERLEYLEFERDELSNLNLTLDCDKEIDEEIAKLSNYDKIYNSLAEAYNLFDDDNDPLSKIYDAAKALSDIEEYDIEYKNNASKLMDAYYISSDIKDDIRRALDNMDFDQNYLNSLIERQNEIEHAKDKYKKSVNELIEYLNKITLDIEITTNYDQILNETINKLKVAFEHLSKLAINLSLRRKKIAKEFALAIIKECRDLDLENTRFEVSFNEIDLSDYLNKSIFTEDGIDEVSFNLSFNKGESLKPLYKVASGGEASRLMLALKSYLKSRLNIDLFIFDEIDTGVSGITAKKIAKKMYEIANDIQVICITHLPQVAAIADYEKFIYKKEIDGRTITEIEDLSYDRRVEEIAMMLSGDKLSSFALDTAKELLKK